MPSDSPTSRGQLLLVDDNPLNRERLAARLQAEGYTVATASDATSALEVFTDHPCELVLLDSVLPAPGGLAALKTLRTHPATREVPVIMVAGLEDTAEVAACLEQGAADYVPSPFDPLLLTARIDACLETMRLRQQEQLFLQQLKDEKDHSDRLVKLVIPIGIELMREPDYNRLLEKILVEAKSLCQADGGTLYLRTPDDRLRFVMLRNDSLQIDLGGTTGKPITFPPLNLHDPVTGQPNHSQVACHVALTGNSVNIPDAYHAEGFDFHGTREFDKKTRYRSQSFLTVPLKDRENLVIGVLQLINARLVAGATPIPFSDSLQRSVESLSSLAAAALEQYGPWGQG